MTTTTTTFKSFSAKSGAIRALRKVVGDEPSNYLQRRDGKWGYAVREYDGLPVSLQGLRNEQANAASDEEPSGGTFNAGAFDSLVKSQLSSADHEAAEEQAIAALKKARAPKAQPSAVKPALTTPYVLGAYKGRAGAMYAFMGRMGTLGDVFNREDAVASIVAKPCHDAVGTRAQALDYFAWAARHGLLVEATPAEVAAWAAAQSGEADAAAEKKAEAKAKRAARKAEKATA